MEEVIVFGHKSPDTDTICSAIVMADLQTKIRGEKLSLEQYKMIADYLKK